jgi:hypothetical protein
LSCHTHDSKTRLICQDRLGTDRHFAENAPVGEQGQCSICPPIGVRVGGDGAPAQSSTLCSLSLLLARACLGKRMICFQKEKKRQECKRSVFVCVADALRKPLVGRLERRVDILHCVVEEERPVLRAIAYLQKPSPCNSTTVVCQDRLGTRVETVVLPRQARDKRSWKTIGSRRGWALENARRSPPQPRRETLSTIRSGTSPSQCSPAPPRNAHSPSACFPTAVPSLSW